MRSRRSGPGRPLGDTKVSGRRVTSKAPLALLAGGSGRPEASPTAILQDTHSLAGTFLGGWRENGFIAIHHRLPPANGLVRVLTIYV
jgi:hypothetical protein